MRRTIRYSAITLVLFVLATVALAACARPGAEAQQQQQAGETPATEQGQTTPDVNSPTIGMTNTAFKQETITIAKGQTVRLLNDSSVPHFISNGMWQGNQGMAMKEAGAPVADNVALTNGKSQIVGPFNTAGTFQYYCTVHPGMNLKIIVQ